MRSDRELARNIRIGLLVASSLLILMVVLFFIGSEQKLFAKKNAYEVRLESVSGLAEGNPVKMSGVTIGAVRGISLPRDPKLRSVIIELAIDRKFEERIRLDSRARLKKLGLLAGDSYIDITPGSTRFPMIRHGDIIPAMRQTNVDQLISSGEDLVDNFVQISYSLKNVLGRIDRGEGLIGELTTVPQNKQRLTDTLLVTLEKTNAMLAHIESGRGVVGKLVYDDAYATQLTHALGSGMESLQIILGSLQRSFETGDGVLPALLSDPEGKQKVFALVDNLRITSERLAAFSQGLESGQGLVPRLLKDKEYADQTLREFNGLVTQLNGTAKKLNEGEGTAGRLISDPSIYESINDILIGLNESRMLRWLVRSRQQKGIDRRYGTESGQQPEATPPPPPAPKSIITPPVEPPPPAIPAVAPEQVPPTDTTGTVVPEIPVTPAQPPTDTTGTQAPPPPTTTNPGNS